jgi:large conductance mechanosensitive channel
MPPRLGPDGGYEDDEESDHDLLDESRRRASRILHGFIDFAFQGNVLEIAFGLIIASMFTALITSLVSDILLPPISVLLPLNKNLEEKFAVLRAGPHRPEDSGYNTLKQAQDDGAVVMAYGWVFYFYFYRFHPCGDCCCANEEQLLSQPADQFHGCWLLALWPGGAVPVLFRGPHHQAYHQVQVLPEEDQ